MNLLDLPRDVLKLFSDYIEASGRLSMSMVCKYTAEIINNQTFVCDCCGNVITGGCYTGRIFGDVATAGQHNMITWLRDIGFRIPSSACESAASAGRLDTLQLLVDMDVLPTAAAATAAAAGGYLHILEWINDYSASLITVNATRKAARYGHLECVRWLYYKKQNNPFVIMDAAKGGHLDIVQYIGGMPYISGLTSYQRAAATAARKGHLHIIKWLYEQGWMLNVSVAQNAAQSGHLEVLKWLHAIGMVFDKNVFAQAAASGNIKQLVWLKEIGCPFDSGVFEMSAVSGFTHIVKWAINNAPYTDKVFLIACKYNHLHLVKLLISHGYTIPRDAINVAIARGYVSIAQWAHDAGMIDKNDPSVAIAALRFCKMRIVEWVCENGYALSAVLCEAAAHYCRIDILKLLRQYGCPWDVTTRFALDHYTTTIHSSKQIQTQRSKRYIEMLTYLDENDCPRE